MISIEDAFRKFKHRLELNDREQANAIARHQEVRDQIRDKFKVDTDFLTGSYARWTKTKPLKDIDIFFVLKNSESAYLSKSPSVVLDDFFSVLKEKYGDRVKRQRRSLNVSFGVSADGEDNTDYRVMSVDVVPAFASGDNYAIPDEAVGEWIDTNPKIHADKAAAAHQAYSSEWKGIVRMLKYWNNNPAHGEKPIKPSFLIEVMCLQALHGGWGGSFEREIQGVFATLADRIFDTFDDPAGLGPPISDEMDQARKQRAQSILRAAEREAAIAIDHARRGRQGEALRAWRALFGVKFPLS